MSFATVANLATIILCAAVLVQSVRMMRSLHAVRSSGIAEMVAALDTATGEARAVLSELKAALGACADTTRPLVESRAIAEELAVMIGIANASADRISEVANAAHRRGTPAPKRSAAAPSARRVEDAA